MPKGNKVKKPIIPEDKPPYLEAEDYESVRENISIYRYQQSAVNRQSKKTGRSKSEIFRVALDALLFKQRRASDHQVNDKD
jgi:hypothetical protein